MENIKSAAAAVCMVSAGICAVRSLVSGSALSKKAELILKTVFVIVLFSHFVSGCLNIELPRTENYELTEYGYSKERYNEELIRQTEENLSAVLVQQLQSNGIVCDNLSVSVNISEDDSIFISKVTVSTDDHEKAAEIIHNCLGSDTEAVFEDN